MANRPVMSVSSDQNFLYSSHQFCKLWLRWQRLFWKAPVHKQKILSLSFTLQRYKSERPQVCWTSNTHTHAPHFANSTKIIMREKKDLASVANRRQTSLLLSSCLFLHGDRKRRKKGVIGCVVRARELNLPSRPWNDRDPNASAVRKRIEISHPFMGKLHVSLVRIPRSDMPSGLPSIVMHFTHFSRRMFSLRYLFRMLLSIFSPYSEIQLLFEKKYSQVARVPVRPMSIHHVRKSKDIFNFIFIIAHGKSWVLNFFEIFLNFVQPQSDIVQSCEWHGRDRQLCGCSLQTLSAKIRGLLAAIANIPIRGLVGPSRGS